MMTSGEATGWGQYEGDSFAMMHQPASGYFGFQMGEGANNKNANYGFSGWFYLSGVVDGSPSTPPATSLETSIAASPGRWSALTR